MAQTMTSPQARRIAQQQRRRRSRQMPTTTTAATTALAPTSERQSEWERWLAQFGPEMRALMNLMVDINCRLAREAASTHNGQSHGARQSA